GAPRRVAGHRAPRRLRAGGASGAGARRRGAGPGDRALGGGALRISRGRAGPVPGRDAHPDLPLHGAADAADRRGGWRGGLGAGRSAPRSEETTRMTGPRSESPFLTAIAVNNGLA